jgi:hypothetical protein
MYEYNDIPLPYFVSGACFLSIIFMKYFNAQESRVVILFIIISVSKYFDSWPLGMQELESFNLNFVKNVCVRQQ